MRQSDMEYIQIVNVIRRSQKLLLQAKREGADVKLAEELINEAKYALKHGQRDRSVDYSKNCMLEIIKSKRALNKETLSREGVMERLTKEELRQKCRELDLDPVGLKTELIERLRLKFSEMEGNKAVEVPQENKAEEAPRGVETEEGGIPDAISPDDEAENLIPGISYLVEESRADRCFILYNSLMGKGRSGFSISRTNPKLLTKNYGISGEDILWLTDREMGTGVRSVPPSLESIIYYIEEFIDENKDGVILLDGIEYLIGNNTFNPVIRFLRRLVDKVSTTESILLVSLSPTSMEKSQVTLLEKDLFPLNYR